MIRPILTAVIEYTLAFIVFKYGKNHKNIIALVLFLLASYQLGEVLVFMTNGEQWAFKVAYVSTTLLPPLGVLLVSRIMKKQLGYILFQLVSLGFVAYMILTPQIILKFEFGQFCIRILEYTPIISQYWLYYYQGTLMFTMLAGFIGYLSSHNNIIKDRLKWILIAYFSFDGISIAMVYIEPWFGPSSASLMCALALFAAFIFTKISLPNDFDWHKVIKIGSAGNYIGAR